MNKISVLQKLADEIDGDEKVKKQEQENNGQGKQPEASSSSPQEPEQSAATPPDPKVIIEFFQTNPDVNDEAFHEFVEGQGWDVHQAEGIVYKLATRFVNLLKGGKMNETDEFDLSAVNPNELQMGIKVEMEHTPDPTIAKKIALDHLAEISDYYTRLDKMENEAKQSSNAAAAPSEEEENGKSEAAEIQENGGPEGQAPSSLYKQSAYQRAFNLAGAISRYHKFIKGTA